MSDTQGDTVADIFWHLALGESLASVKPAEYWESHAEAPWRTGGGAGGPLPLFVSAAWKGDGLGFTTYARLLTKGAAGAAPQTLRAPGAGLIALDLLKEHARRLLFCDREAEHLQAIRALAGSTSKVECIQEDGVSILRGAAMLLPEPWPASTFAFLNPPDIREVSDAEISPLQLWCELASRGIMAVMTFRVKTAGEQMEVRGAIKQAAEKARLTGRGAQRFEGTLVNADPAAGAGPWGFGLLAANMPVASLDRVNGSLRALEKAFSAGAHAWVMGREAV